MAIENTLLINLASLGADIEDGLMRFSGNETLYVKLLKKFPAAAKAADAATAMETRDFDVAVKHAHTLKGVTGNLSLTPLYEAYSELVDALRAGRTAKAADIMAEFAPLQEKFIAVIETD